MVRGDFEDSESRKREILADYDAWRILNIIVDEMDAATSYQILMDMEDHWNAQKCSRYKWETWYYFVCQLVRNVKKSEEYTRKFREKYEGIVNPIFRFLGAESLVERYQVQRLKGYKVPDALQEEKIRFLCSVFHAVIPYVIETEKIEFKVSHENTVQIDPLQFSEKIYSSDKKNGKYKINKVILNSEDFKEGAFQDTFIKMADILLHTYGSSRSEKLNVLLTHMGEYIIKNRRLLKKAEEKWDKL